MTESKQSRYEECRFCRSNPNRRIIAGGKLGFAAWDLNPVNEGHSLVIPHLHIHVIPRYQGDVENPKGGVRGLGPHGSDTP